MRHADLQRSRGAPGGHLHSRGHARQSRSGGAHGDHLAPISAEMGMLRSESAQDRGTAALAESLTAAAGALRFSGARGVGGDLASHNQKFMLWSTLVGT